ncbi:MAG: TlpA family protein disulfide reductase [Candidimonas sp.]|nr:MAG: TlpA family protein disulfide reductase [Candidimonas sp.]
MKRREFILCGVVAAAVAEGLRPRSALGETGLFSQSFPDVRGTRHAMSRYLGKPLVVNFWATWCPPCVREMPELDALQKRYPAVQFLGLAIDTEDNVREFARKVPVSYPLLIVGHGGIDLVRSLGDTAGGVPFTVVFDHRGAIRERVLGPVQADAFAAVVRKLAD